MNEIEEFEFRRRRELERQPTEQSAFKADQIPGSAPAVTAQPEPSLLDKIKGYGEAGLSAATGIVGGLAGNVVGVAKTLTGGQYGSPEGIRQGADTARNVATGMTYQPRGQSGRDTLQAIGDALSATKLAGIGPSEAMALGAASGGALRQINQGIVKPTVSAIANSPEADLLKQGVRSVAQSVLPMPKQEVAGLARKAIDMGIQLRPDMLTDNRFARMIGEAFEKVPLSGSKADARQIAFNRALTNQIGGDHNATRLTPDVFSQAMSQSGEKIGQIAAKTPIALNENARLMLASHASDAEKFLTSDTGKIVKNYISEFELKGDGGIVDGKAFRILNSKLGAQVRSTRDGDLRNALSNLQDDLQDLLKKNVIDPQDLADLQVARKQYAIGKTIEPLIAKTLVGNVSPSGLMGAVTNTSFKKSNMARGGGDMGDLARIGQLFLKEPPSSGTSERALAYGLMGGGGFVEPHAAAAIYTGASIYNNAAPSATRGILNLANISDLKR